MDQYTAHDIAFLRVSLDNTYTLKYRPAALVGLMLNPCTILFIIHPITRPQTLRPQQLSTQLNI